jgi:hypothetical protein
MIRDIIDSTVLATFSMLYTCAVFLLRYRRKPSVSHPAHA